MPFHRDDSVESIILHLINVFFDSNNLFISNNSREYLCLSVTLGLSSFFYTNFSASFMEKIYGLKRVEIRGDTYCNPDARLTIMHLVTMVKINI